MNLRLPVPDNSNSQLYLISCWWSYAQKYFCVLFYAPHDLNELWNYTAGEKSRATGYLQEHISLINQLSDVLILIDSDSDSAGFNVSTNTV